MSPVLGPEWTPVVERGAGWLRPDGRALWVTIVRRVPASGWFGLALEVDVADLGDPGLAAHDHALLFEDVADAEVVARVSVFVETWLGRPPGPIAWVDPMVWLRVVRRADGRRLSAVLTMDVATGAWTSLAVESMDDDAPLGVLDQHAHHPVVVGVDMDRAVAEAEAVIGAFLATSSCTPWCPCGDIA